MHPTHFQLIKRFIDLLCASIAIVLLSPLLLLVAMISLLVQGPPVFFVSRRYISPEKEVPIFKFRSMVCDAASKKYALSEKYMKNGYLDIPADCDVYTTWGKFLERSQIVELPQLINIFVDGMSCVGNRALPRENIEYFGNFPGWEERFDCPCGLTGASQVVGKFNLTPEQRIRIECLYSRVYKTGNILKCDFLIVLSTVRLILFNRTVDYDKLVALLESCIPEK